MSRSRSALALLPLAALALAACGAPRTETTTSPSAGTTQAADACAPANLKLVTAGTLTIGTDKPAYAPWFIDDTPSNGKGYESAVAYAVAAKMGFPKDRVTWVPVTFDQAKAPGKKTFDFDVNQVSISEERRKAVDFSSGYYDVRQAVITTKGSKIADAKTVAELKDAKLGAQVGTTSYDAITQQIAPTQQVAVFDTNDLAVQSLKTKQIDGIVVDVPTAFYMTAAQLDNGVIVGQLPAAGGAVEQFGAVLAKGSPLTACVSKAVDALRTDGTLTSLQTQWLSNSGAPELK